MKGLVRKIKKLTKMLLNMAYKVEDSFSASIRTLLEGNEMLAKKIIAEDDKIDTMENKIDRMCLNIFALNQPVAMDLRFVLMASKMVSDLERIGDMSCNIAAKSINFLKKKNFELYPLDNIKKMGKLIKGMMTQMIEAYTDEDNDLAREVILKDSEVDELYDEIMNMTIEKANSDKKNLKMYTDVMLIVKDMERIGDHVTNMCEDIIYMITGEVVKHAKIR